MQVQININGTVKSTIDKCKKMAFEQYKDYILKNGYSEISKIFYGQLENTILCKGCNNISYKY